MATQPDASSPRRGRESLTQHVRARINMSVAGMGTVRAHAPSITPAPLSPTTGGHLAQRGPHSSLHRRFQATRQRTVGANAASE